jgi:hypothetical protein
MNEIYQKSKTCQKPAIEISVACQAGQVWQGRLPTPGEAWVKIFHPTHG